MEHPGRAVCNFCSRRHHHCRLQPDTRPFPKKPKTQLVDEETVETVELDPAVTKLDEAQIGTAGPEQIENAIETLDAQTVWQTAAGQRTRRARRGRPAAVGDLFDRMRAGFELDDVEHAASTRAALVRQHPDYLERAFGRAELYLYHIVTELEARGMPLELALLPVVESAFEPYAYSRARASGLWQFIPGTGSRFGLKQNWWYDGRRDVVESTRAALDYLQYLHDEFDGDWLLAVAAYNCGEDERGARHRRATARRASRPISGA